MSDFSLYDRFRNQGTISEKPEDVPDVRYALPSMVNWMRALSIVSVQQEVNFKTSGAFYSGVQKRNLSDKELNTVFEQLLFTLNQIASLKALSTIQNPADVARVAIVSWYYGIYSSCSAMIAAADGTFQDSHMPTANAWDRQFAANKLAMPPFSPRISNLVDDVFEAELKTYTAISKHDLITTPKDSTQSWGCIAQYLSGTAQWEQWNIRERVKETKDFKALNVENFRTAAARSLRDKAYENKSVSFLHQAIRYRGKVNYRDAVVLSYGRSIPSHLTGFTNDLEIVLSAFACMAAGYISKRIGKDLWISFVNDLESKRSFTTSPKEIWS